MLQDIKPFTRSLADTNQEKQKKKTIPFDFLWYDCSWQTGHCNHLLACRLRGSWTHNPKAGQAAASSK